MGIWLSHSHDSDSLVSVHFAFSKGLCTIVIWVIEAGTSKKKLLSGNSSWLWSSPFLGELFQFNTIRNNICSYYYIINLLLVITTANLVAWSRHRIYFVHKFTIWMELGKLSQLSSGGVRRSGMLQTTYSVPQGLPQISGKWVLSVV